MDRAAYNSALVRPLNIVEELIQFRQLNGSRRSSGSQIGSFRVDGFRRRVHLKIDGGDEIMVLLSTFEDLPRTKQQFG